MSNPFSADSKSVPIWYWTFNWINFRSDSGLKGNILIPTPTYISGFLLHLIWFILKFFAHSFVTVQNLLLGNWHSRKDSPSNSEFSFTSTSHQMWKRFWRRKSFLQAGNQIEVNEKILKTNWIRKSFPRAGNQIEKILKKNWKGFWRNVEKGFEGKVSPGWQPNWS